MIQEKGMTSNTFKKLKPNKTEFEKWFDEYFCKPPQQLKTLKDLEVEDMSDVIVLSYKLRDEARKWLKHLEQKDKHWKLEPRLAIRDWIRHFFNLEDDN